MEVFISQQFTVLLYACVLGVFLGVLYDVFRIMRVMMGVKYAGIVKKTTDRIKLPKIESFVRRTGEGKISVKMREIGIAAGDVAFFFLAGIAMCIFIYWSNNGKFRFFALAGAAAGFSLYYFTLGKLIIMLSEYICFFLRAAFGYILYFTLTPLIWVCKKIFFAFSWILLKILLLLSLIYDKIRLEMYSFGATRRMIGEANSGFSKTVRL